MIITKHGDVQNSEILLLIVNASTTYQMYKMRKGASREARFVSDVKVGRGYSLYTCSHP